MQQEIQEILEKLYEFKDDQVTFEIEKAKVLPELKKLGINKIDFKNIWLAYVREKTPPQQIIYQQSEFEAPEGFESLTSNRWINQNGRIYCMTEFGAREACPHPIVPVQRLQNIESGTEKIKVAFKSGSSWREIIADRKTFSTTQGITELTNHGVRLTSETAKYLVQYLHDIEIDNEHRIETKHSVSHIGWIDGFGFAPYCEGIVFDGQSQFRQPFESINAKGSEKKWMDEILKGRQYGKIGFRVSMAASFASALIKPMMKMPFCMHLFGVTGTGKTVAMIAAASVWGNPNEGYLLKTFNGTNTSVEMLATFYNSIPVFLNEMEIVKDEKISPEKILYSFCEGSGKNRSNRQLGLNHMNTWKNCLMTNAEHAIIKGNSGGGAANRVIEVECKGSVLENPAKSVKLFRENYGFLGEKWIEWISDEENVEKCHGIYDKIYEKVIEFGITEKQAMAASVLLTADYFATQLFFKDDKRLLISDIVEFLKDKSEISNEERAYEFMKSWVAINETKFCEGTIERWGKFDRSDSPEYVFIVGSKFEEVLEKNGFAVKPFITHLRQNGLLESNEKSYKTVQRIGASTARCVKFKLEKIFVEVDEPHPFDEVE